jgi:hypothetical protein
LFTYSFAVCVSSSEKDKFIYFAKFSIICLFIDF